MVQFNTEIKWCFLKLCDRVGAQRKDRRGQRIGMSVSKPLRVSKETFYFVLCSRTASIIGHHFKCTTKGFEMSSEFLLLVKIAGIPSRRRTVMYYCCSLSNGPIVITTTQNNGV